MDGWEDWRVLEAELIACKDDLGFEGEPMECKDGVGFVQIR